MLDIKLFRANPEMVKEKLAARNLDTDVVDLLIDLDKKRRSLLVEVEDLKALRNKRSEEIAVLKRKREDATDVINDMKKVSDEITTRDIEVKQISEEINEKIIRIPNLISDETPFGETEDENIEVRRIGKVREFDFEPKAHWDLVEELELQILNVLLKYQEVDLYSIKKLELY